MTALTIKTYILEWTDGGISYSAEVEAISRADAMMKVLERSAKPITFDSSNRKLDESEQTNRGKFHRAISNLVNQELMLKAYSEGEVISKCYGDANVADFVRDCYQYEVFEIETSKNHWLQFVVEIKGIELNDYTEGSEELAKLFKNL